MELCARAGWTLVDFASACLDGGARLLQIRAKSSGTGTMLEATRRIVDRARGAMVIVNDRGDIAKLARASGVHVGQDDLSPRAVRSIVGDSAVVGLSTHTGEQIERAIGEPVSYLAIGPVFATATKDTGYFPVGLDRVRQAAAAVRSSALPVVAIGGITLATVPSVLSAGASSVAVAGDLLAEGSPGKRVREYLHRLGS